jgi:hypothetical protein
MNARRAIRASGVAGMAAATVWVIALIVEYRYGLQPPGDASGLYKADQAAFFVAQVGYLVMLGGLFSLRAGGDGWFGRAAIGLWGLGVAAIVIGQALGFFGVSAIFLLPTSGVGQIVGSVLTAVAVWRAGRWSAWRRFAPAAWTVYFLVLIGSVIAAIPSVTIPAAGPNPRGPSPLAEGVWQGAWFLVSLAVYVEAGRMRRPNRAGSE